MTYWSTNISFCTGPSISKHWLCCADQDCLGCVSHPKSISIRKAELCNAWSSGLVPWWIDAYFIKVEICGAGPAQIIRFLSQLRNIPTPGMLFPVMTRYIIRYSREDVRHKAWFVWVIGLCVHKTMRYHRCQWCGSGRICSGHKTECEVLEGRR